MVVLVELVAFGRVRARASGERWGVRNAFLIFFYF